MIVAAGDADAVSDGDGEGVGIAATADWQRNTISKQEIFITHKSQMYRFNHPLRRLRYEADGYPCWASVTVCFSSSTSLGKISDLASLLVA